MKNTSNIATNIAILTNNTQSTQIINIHTIKQQNEATHRNMYTYMYICIASCQAVMKLGNYKTHISSMKEALNCLFHAGSGNKLGQAIQDQSKTGSAKTSISPNWDISFSELTLFEHVFE